MWIEKVEQEMNTPSTQKEPQGMASTSTTDDRWKDVKDMVSGIALLMVFLCVGVGPVITLCLMDAPTILPEDHPAAYSWRTKTLLNAGGLGRLYWEGSECVVDLHATFEPLGTYGGKTVGRYTPRQSWWGWWQCPAGSLIELTLDESPAWKASVAKQVAAENERAQALRALTETAKQP